MTYARRVDGPHKAITEALRKCGWLVRDTSRLAEFVDLVAYKADRGIVLIEVKTLKGKPTDAQLELLADGWPVVTVRSVDDAVNI